MKKILYLSFITCSILSMQHPVYLIPKENLVYPQRLGRLSVLFDDKGFKVKKGSQEIQIPPYCLENKLRGISREQLDLMISRGNSYLVVNINDHNGYSLRLNGRLLSCTCCKPKNNDKKEAYQ